MLLVARGLVPNRQQSQGMILAGEIWVAGKVADKAGLRVPIDAEIEIRGQRLRYASRGGLKLEGALEEFEIDVTGKACVDIGSSNGGFTDCLLQHGARRVYAVDVTTSQLDWKLQQDSRVIMVRRNARYLRPEDTGEPAELITVDVSFISAAKILPAAVAVSGSGAIFLILVKPQFELEKRLVGKGGIVRDAALHDRAIQGVWQAALESGLHPERSIPSRIQGTEGNQEFFLLAWRGGRE